MSALPGKHANALAYPVRAQNPSGLLTRVEAVITPEQLRTRWLWEVLPFLARLGITYTDAMLKDRIGLAITQAEMILKVNIFPEPFFERLPFDRNLYQSWVRCELENRPIQTVTALKIESANFENIYQIDPSWIEMGNAFKGILNVVPLMSAYSAGQSMTAYANGAAAYLLIAANVSWIPDYWSVYGTSGLSSVPGEVPIIVNSLIGVLATIQILSGAALANPYNSQSLSQDGIAQASATAGVNIFMLRLQELEVLKKEYVGQIQRIFNSRVFITNI